MAIAFGHENLDALAQHVCRRVAEHVLRATIHENDLALAIRSDDRVGGGIDDLSCNFAG